MLVVKAFWGLRQEKAWQESIEMGERCNGVGGEEIFMRRLPMCGVLGLARRAIAAGLDVWYVDIFCLGTSFIHGTERRTMEMFCLARKIKATCTPYQNKIAH